ncbi:site-specific integrase, partial [Rhodopirellula sp. SWK7]|uniref:site-specific integrase n=1 Tax=Rhodopirellula sp. SWK7 TaxID=595460 RepID=UPI0002BE6621
MANYCKSSSGEQGLKWARIWFKQFCLFHRRPVDPSKEFTAEEVIAFLRSKRDAGVLAWKRMKVIEGLIVFRESVQHRDPADLLPLRETMRGIVSIERAKSEGYDTIDDVVGKIDPKEPDAIQEFRRSLRRGGMALRTERTYVGKLKNFMADRGLTCLADFERIGAADVEAHLTDLAVDGNVAPSTQNVSFHSLLKFFTLVLKREMGKIEAIRATKKPMTPTVL